MNLNKREKAPEQTYQDFVDRLIRAAAVVTGAIEEDLRAVWDAHFVDKGRDLDRTLTAFLLNIGRRIRTDMQLVGEERGHEDVQEAL